MIKRVKRLRFQTEPAQLRNNAFGGVMNDGDEKNVITFDDVSGAVYFTRPHPTEKVPQVRVVPLTACAWLELLHEPEAKGPAK